MSSDKDINYRKEVIVILVLIILFNLILNSFSIRLPFELIYGPILFYLQRLNVGRTMRPIEVIGHAIPFILISILDVEPVVYLIAIVMSLITYGVVIWRTAHHTECDPQSQQLIFQLNLNNFAIAAFIAFQVLLHFEIVRAEDIGFNLNIFVLGLQVLAVLILLIHLFSSVYGQEKDPVATIDTSSSALDRITLSRYAAQIESGFKSKQLHLRSSLSLDDLSKELDIPKHHLSRVFSLHYNKPYYQYVAEARIEEAISKLESGENLTLESLAYECGFNSKTTFNKYFKEIVGQTPSEYRNRTI